MDDKEFILECAKYGDDTAFLRLYKMIYINLYQFAYCLCGSEKDAVTCVKKAIFNELLVLNKIKNQEIFIVDCYRYVYKNSKMREIKNHKTSQYKIINLFQKLKKEERIVVGLNLFAKLSINQICGITKYNKDKVSDSLYNGINKISMLLGVNNNEQENSI